MKLVRTLLALTATSLLCAIPIFAQSAAAPKPTADPATGKPAANAAQAMRCDAERSAPERTFYLNNSVQQSDANEITTALRNLLDACDRVYLVNSQSAIVMQGSPEQLALAQKLITDLDRPRKTYRLTYSVTEVDNGKRVGTQHFAMVVVAGQNTTLRQGSKVPIATGSYSASGASTNPPGLVQTQTTYIDIGMAFDATLDEFANGVRLRSKVEQSSLAPETSGVGAQDPIVRQTSLQGAAFLTPGKPLMLGSIDILGSTRHIDIEVVMEQLP